MSTEINLKMNLFYLFLVNFDCSHYSTWNLIYDLFSSVAMQSSEGPPVEHVTVYGSASGSVRSASPNVQTTLAGPMMTVQQTQTQATAFVQPTQQQSMTHAEPANQEMPSAVIEATPSSQVEWPSTSSNSSVFGTGEQNPSRVFCSMVQDNNECLCFG